ncbi:MAG: hypothetical protein IK028_00755 [Bacilli bacterium]|nr:hypothetical protein [Bacilli bacterium]
MNAKNKRTSGILMGSMLIGGILFIGAILLPLIISDKTIEQETKIGTIVIYSFIALLFTIVGIYSLVKGLTAYKSMSRGRKRGCKIVDIINSKVNSMYKEITVEYRGESGDKRRHIVPINFASASKLKVGQIIECYIRKDECYVDVDHLVILQEPEEVESE